MKTKTAIDRILCTILVLLLGAAGTEAAFWVYMFATGQVENRSVEPCLYLDPSETGPEASPEFYGVASVEVL